MHLSQLEAEINERLQDCHQKLLQAGVDQKESERGAKFKETLASLQRILPGVKGRVVDLCTPTARKYETAISVVLGRNIDAIVVETEKVAIECIEVSDSNSTYEDKTDSGLVHADPTGWSGDVHPARYHQSQALE